MLRAARVPPAVRPPRRHRPRARGLGRQAAHDLGRAGRRATPRSSVGGAGHGGGDDTWLEGVPLQPGPERHGRHRRRSSATWSPPASWSCPPHDAPTTCPDEIQVEADGPIRIVRLNRPEQLNATNHELHQAPGRRSSRSSTPTSTPGSRCSPATAGPSRPAATSTTSTSSTDDDDLRAETLVDGRQIVTGMVACRVPVVAAVNGPAVGLGCSLVALSDIVFMAESAHLADPHVLVGLVAADGGPVTWPLLTSLQLAKEYALTGDRIPAAAGRRDRPRQPRVPRRRGARPGAGLRPAASPSCPSGPPRTPSASSTCTSSGPCSPPSTSPSPPRTARSRRPSCGPTSTASCRET